MKNRIWIVAGALLVSLAFASAARASDADTDEVEVSAFGGMHVRQDRIALPNVTGLQYNPLGAGALGGVELAYRHDSAPWSFAGGMRVQYEAYVLDGWLTGNDGPNQTFQPASPSDVSATITSLRESIVAIGVPLRAQREVAPSVGLYVLAEPMIVAQSRLVVASYVHGMAYDVTVRDDHLGFAVYGAVGLDVRVGPGRIFLELGGRGGADAHGTTGIFNPSGWSMIAGYRLGVR